MRGGDAHKAQAERRCPMGDVTDDEPGRFARYQEWMLKQTGDIRCIGAPTCPFHHKPSEERPASGRVAPWDEP